MQQSSPGRHLSLIGPTDLSVSLGYEGEIDHPEVSKAFDMILSTARRYGVKVGIHTKDAKEAKARREWGTDYVGLTVTSLINRAFSDHMKAIKS